MPVSTAPVNAAVDATARWVQAATREPVTLEQAAALSAPLRADEITVDPLSGLTYLRLSGYLARLKAAFGDDWFLMRCDSPSDHHDSAPTPTFDHVVDIGLARGPNPGIHAPAADAALTSRLTAITTVVCALPTDAFLPPVISRPPTAPSSVAQPKLIVVPPPLHLLDAPTPKELMRLQRHLGPGWRAVDPSHENDGPRDGEAMPPWVAVAMTALVRLGKDLGIALELWEAGVAGRLRDQGPYVRVWVSAAPNATGAKGAKKAAQGRYQWVRKSAT